MPSVYLRLIPLLGLSLALNSALSGCGVEREAHPVRAELVASVEAVCPGEPFTLGVLLIIEPDWHVYWKYAGDAGLPTEIEWRLPEGWSVGELQWPVPRGFVENGPLTTYGYTDSVMLLAEVYPSDGPGSGESVHLAAQVDWMVCHDECVPGKATVTLDLPMVERPAAVDAGSASSARLRSWQENLPKVADSSGWIVQAESSPGGDTQAIDIRLKISPLADSSPTAGEWFPAPSPDWLVKNTSVATVDGATVVSFSVHAVSGPIGTGDVFESLLVYRDVNGYRRGVRIVTPLSKQSAS